MCTVFSCRPTPHYSSVPCCSRPPPPVSYLTLLEYFQFLTARRAGEQPQRALGAATHVIRSAKAGAGQQAAGRALVGQVLDNLLWPTTRSAGSVARRRSRCLPDPPLPRHSIPSSWRTVRWTPSAGERSGGGSEQKEDVTSQRVQRNETCSEARLARQSAWPSQPITSP